MDLIVVTYNRNILKGGFIMWPIIAVVYITMFFYFVAKLQVIMEAKKNSKSEEFELAKPNLQICGIHDRKAPEIKETYIISDDQLGINW